MAYSTGTVEHKPIPEHDAVVKGGKETAGMRKVNENFYRGNGRQEVTPKISSTVLFSSKDKLKWPKMGNI